MREMHQLPKPSVWRRSRRALTAVVLIWAVAAVPLTLWTGLRTPPPQEHPEWRALTVVEESAVRYGSRALRTEAFSLTSTVTSPMMELRVEETVDPTRTVSVGVVRSGSHTAQMVAANGRVLLRDGAPFWSTLGVPTADPGWVDVGDRLGVRVTFPLEQAAAAMVAGPQATISAGSAETSTFRNGALTVVFGHTGVSTITFSERTAAVSGPNGYALAKLAGTPAPGWDAGVAALAGAGGALTVTPATPAPPAGTDAFKEKSEPSGAPKP